MVTVWHKRTVYEIETITVILRREEGRTDAQWSEFHHYKNDNESNKKEGKKVGDKNEKKTREESDNKHQSFAGAHRRSKWGK